MSGEKEIAIDEIATIEGKTVKCVSMPKFGAGYVCTNCVFNGTLCTPQSPLHQKCSPWERSDKQFVVFQEVVSE